MKFYNIEIKFKIPKDKKQKSTTKTMHRNFLGDALISELGDASRLQCKVLCRKYTDALAMP